MTNFSEKPFLPRFGGNLNSLLFALNTDIDDEDLAEIMKSIRVHGSNGNDKYNNVRIGINGRLDTIQAAILLEKFNIFEDELISRNTIADYYKNNINSNFIHYYYYIY